MRRRTSRVRAGSVAALVAGALAVAAAPAGAVDSYKIGQKAPSGDLVFVVHGFQDPYTSPNQFTQPDPGLRQIAVDVEVINKTSEQQSWSSLLLAHLIAKDRRTYDAKLVVTDPPAPDGEIPAKFGVRGLIPFEVPADAAVKFIRLQGNITANGALVKLKVPATPAPAP